MTFKTKLNLGIKNCVPRKNAKQKVHKNKKNFPLQIGRGVITFQQYDIIDIYKDTENREGGKEGVGSPHLKSYALNF